MALRIIKKAKVKMAVATRYGFCKCGSVANATDVAWDCDKVWRMLIVSGNVCEIMDCFRQSPRNDKERKINGNQ